MILDENNLKDLFKFIKIILFRCDGFESIILQKKKFNFTIYERI